MKIVCSLFSVAGLALVAGCSGPSLPDYMNEANPYCVENSERIQGYVETWYESQDQREFMRSMGGTPGAFDFDTPIPEWVEYPDCFPTEIQLWFLAGQPTTWK